MNFKKHKVIPLKPIGDIEVNTEAHAKQFVFGLKTLDMLKVKFPPSVLDGILTYASTEVAPFEYKIGTSVDLEKIYALYESDTEFQSYVETYVPLIEEHPDKIHLYMRNAYDLYRSNKRA